MADVSVRPIAYAVSMWPEGEETVNTSGWTIKVEARGHGKWAVLHSGQCLGTDGEWDWESIPSDRSDEWLATHRFDLDTALDLAQEAAPRVVINGMTPAQVRAWEASRA